MELWALPPLITQTSKGKVFDRFVYLRQAKIINEEVNISDKFTLDEIPFNLDPFYCSELSKEQILSIVGGEYFVDLVKTDPEPFEKSFVSFLSARVYYKYVWDAKKLKCGSVEHEDVYEDRDEDSNDMWVEALDYEVIPSEVEEKFYWADKHW